MTTIRQSQSESTNLPQSTDSSPPDRTGTWPQTWTRRAPRYRWAAGIGTPPWCYPRPESPGRPTFSTAASSVGEEKERIALSLSRDDYDDVATLAVGPSPASFLRVWRKEAETKGENRGAKSAVADCEKFRLLRPNATRMGGFWGNRREPPDENIPTEPNPVTGTWTETFPAGQKEN